MTPHKNSVAIPSGLSFHMEHTNLGNAANMDTVLVTGGAGFVGSHACKELARHGLTPVTFDDLSRGHRDAVRWGPLVEGDILDEARLEQAFRFYRPSSVMHFAALAYVGESVSQPLRYYQTNVDGLVNVLRVMRQHNISTIVFSSSCATYGIPDRIPISEDAPQRPINPYGNSKLACEQILKDCRVAYGLRFAILRYFNAAGADATGELAEQHDPETHLIPIAIDAAMGWAPHSKFLEQITRPAMGPANATLYMFRIWQALMSPRSTTSSKRMSR